MSENETIEVHHKKGEEVIIETLAWPQKYENFIKDIIQKFKLKNNTKIDLDLITNEDDNYQIASQEDLKGYLDDNIVIAKRAGNLAEAKNFEFIKERALVKLKYL